MKIARALLIIILLAITIMVAASCTVAIKIPAYQQRDLEAKKFGRFKVRPDERRKWELFLYGNVSFLKQIKDGGNR